MANILGLVYQPSALAEIECSCLYAFKRLSVVYKEMDPNTTVLVLLASKISIETHPMVDMTALPRRVWRGSVSGNFLGDIVSR